MKRTALLVAIASAIVVSVQAQIPDPPDPVCAHCGVDLKSQVPHKRSCPYYSAPEEEESSSGSSSSSSSSKKPSGPTKENPFADGNCPECGAKVRLIGEYNKHRSGCRLGEAYREYYHWWDVSLHDKKKKVRDEAYSKMQYAYAKCLRVAEEALRRGYPTTQTPAYSSSSSSSTPTPSTSVAQMQIQYECELCKARVMAYNFNDAVRLFADNPWVHKPTCPKYKPKPGQNPSTSLKDYTPAQEHPVVSESLLDMVTCQPTPQFSSINESNIRYDKPMPLTGKHEWGEIDEAATLAYLKKINKGRPTAWKDLEYDIERYNHEGGPVIIGIHQSNGRYFWLVFGKQSNGKYAPVDDSLNRQTEILDDGHGRDVKAQTVDVRYEGQGKFVIREWEGGYKHIYNSSGNIIATGYKVRLMYKMVDGKQLVYKEPDDEGGHCSIIDEN